MSRIFASGMKNEKKISSWNVVFAQSVKTTFYTVFSLYSKRKLKFRIAGFLQKRLMLNELFIRY
jgi:hypothetical protein